MTNLVLFYCDRLQGFFGLGTHAMHLIRYFSTQPDIKTTVVLTETEKYPEVTFLEEEGIAWLYIPCPQNGLFLSMDDTPVAKTLAIRICQIAAPYLQGKENLVFWFNSIAEINVLRVLNQFFQGRSFYVHHGWGWKDYLKVADEAFAAQWKTGNVTYSPQAFESTALQLEMVQNTDYTVTVTEQARRFFISALGVPESKLHRIYNGITPPAAVITRKQVLKEEFGIASHEQVILFCGRVIANKGLLFLMEAFRLLLIRKPNCKLVIAGTGNYPEVLAAARPFWGKVILTGNLSKEYLYKWYSITDVGVIPSLMEQCSYTGIEMRFWHVPLIVSAVDGLDENFEHDTDCLKIPVKYDENGNRTFDPEEIAAHLYTLLHNEEIRARLTQVAYQKAHSCFTLEEMGKGYLKVINQMHEVQY